MARPPLPAMAASGNAFGPTVISNSQHKVSTMSQLTADHHNGVPEGDLDDP